MTGPAVVTTDATPGPQMPWRERLVFAFGDTFGGGSAATIAVLYLFYLTDIIGIEPAAAGATIVVSKVWDAVNHPIFGMFSDNTRSRWGRRRPWIFVGALLLPLAQALLWAPIGSWTSEPAKIAFIIGGHLAYTTIASIVLVPFASLSAEVSTDPDERNTVNVMRLAVAATSGVVCTLLMSALLTSYKNGDLGVMTLYYVLVFGLGTLFALPLIAVAVVTHERAPVPAQAHPSVRAMGEPLKVKEFRQLTLLYLCPALTLDIVTALIIYYATYVVRGVNTTVFFGIFFVIILATFAVVGKLVTRVDKPVIYRRLIPLGLVAVAGVAFYPAHGPVVGVYVLSAFVAIGLAGSQTMTWVMFPDVVDAGELQQGARNAGSFSGLLVFVRALASALAIWILGVTLSVTGYHRPKEAYAVARQPESAILGIRLSLVVWVVVLMCIGYAVARHYRLSRAVCAELTVELAAARVARHAIPPEEGLDALPTFDESAWDELPLGPDGSQAQGPGGSEPPR
ncbi:MAG: MFS transporter [Actinomycetales bacterium]|nr:MFS transporter [Actinomycetales bacterium]